MSNWAKIIEKENTLTDIEQLEVYRSNYQYDPRHLDIAELKWSGLYLDARVLLEEIDKDHQEYYKFDKERYRSYAVTTRFVK